VTFPEFARLHGVSAQAVSKVAASGKLDPFVRWVRRGKLRFGSVTDVERASKLWRSRPGAHAPALANKGGPLSSPRPTPAEPAAAVPTPVGDPLADITAARLHFEGYRAKREQLEFEREAGRVIDVAEAMQIFGRQIAEAKNAILAIGKNARGRLPHLTFDDVATIEGLCREALEGLAAGAIQKTDQPPEGRS
jgi:hypothetical protein